VMMISRSVEISITGGGEEMVRTYFSGSFFLLIFLLYLF